MLRNHPAVQDFLQAGGTLVVPTRRLAAAVRLAFASARIAAGLVCWDTPDVVSWSAWVARRIAPAPAASSSRSLSSAEDWWLWRHIIAECCPVADSDRLADQARRASDLLDSWGLIGPAGPLEEWSLLADARRQLQARSARLAASAGSRWRQIDTAPPRPTWCVGFDELGAADRTALKRLGVSLEPLAGDTATAQIQDFDDREQELLQMADWCRRHLQQDPAARLLLVVPDLARDRADVVRALSWTLDGDAIRAGAVDVSLFQLEPGTALTESPAIAAALHLWRLGCEALEFTALSILLRSPFIDLGDAAARLALESWLRDRQVLQADNATLVSLSRRIEAEAGPGAAAVALRLCAAVVPTPADAPLTAREWATRFADCLGNAGWPDQGSLDPGCGPARQAMGELLADFATLNDVGGLLSGEQALNTLQSLAARTGLEAQLEDVPVTVTDWLGDPVVMYDGIWVCGLTAERWPPAASPNPFISHELLRQSGLDLHLPAGQLRLAGERLRQWQRRTTQVVFSHARLHDDLPLAPSPLLPRAISRSPPGLAHADRWRDTSAVLETYGRQPALPWPADRTVLGGASVLVSQARCPFQALGRWRLACGRLPAPAPGVPATLHGQIVHAALHALWGELKDSGELARREPDWPALVEHCVTDALQSAGLAFAVPPPPALIRVEQRHCERLLLHLLATERARAPFTIQMLETSVALRQRGLGLGLRLDRVDRLASGGSLLIDYKTSRPDAFDADAARPRYTQLLAYALVMDDPLSGLANVHLRSSGATCRGVTAAAGELPGVRAANESGRDWGQSVERWRAIAAQLIDEFVDGEARVDPEPGACRYCHLHTLCRIDAASPVLDQPLEEPNP